MDWYAITVHAGQEFRVKMELERRAASLYSGNLQEVAVPTERTSAQRGGRTIHTETRRLPGYVLVRARLTDEVWALLRATPGVSGIVGATNEPAPLTKLEVDRLVGSTSLPRSSRTPFEVGDAVEIAEGPLVGLSGTVKEMNPDAATAKVLVSMFDREIAAQVTFDQVKAR